MRSHFSILIIFAALSLIGFVLLPLLSIQFLPSHQSRQLVVQYQWPNASPIIVEQTVTSPLEGAFNLLQGIKKIYSVSRKGSGYIQLDIDKKVDIDYLRFEVANKIRLIYPSLPNDVQYPSLVLDTPEATNQNRPLLTYSLSGSDTPSALLRYAKETLSPQLSLQKGIQKIEVLGGNQVEWRITYKEEFCQQIGLKPRDIKNAIYKAFRPDALGRLSEKGNTFFVRLQIPDIPQNKVSSKDFFQKIPISKKEGRIVRLKDIAQIDLVEQTSLSHYRINGKNSIRLLIFPEKKVNTLRVANSIKESIPSITNVLPASYQLSLDNDTTEYMAVELAKIGQRTLFSLGILLLFVLVVYRNITHLAILFCSLIANLGISFIFYYWLGVELHLYALAGITVSFGIIIDNSLVMLHHLQGQNNLRVFRALFTSTLTTLAALVIIFFLPEQWQWNLVEFAKVIGINLTVSLIVSWYFIPALVHSFGLTASKQLLKNTSERIISKNKNSQKIHLSRNVIKRLNLYERQLSFLLKWKKTVLVLVLLAFGLPVFLLPNKIQDWSWYNASLGNEWYVENVKPSINKYLGGSLRLFLWYVYEGSNYRQAEESVLHIEGGMPNGTTVKQMNAVFQQIEQYLAQFEVPIKQYVTNVQNGQYAHTQVFFKKDYQLGFPHQLKNRLIAFSINLGGVEWNIYGVGKGFNTEMNSMPPQYRKAMYGYNKKELQNQTERFAQKLTAHPRIKEVNTNANIDWWTKDLYEYELAINKERLASFNQIPIHLSAVFDNFNKRPYPHLYTPNQEAVRLVSSSHISNTLWRLQNEAIPIDSSFIHFQEISSLKKEKVAGAIHKENQQYIQVLEWEYLGTSRFGAKYLEQCLEEMEQELPLGYTIKDAPFQFGANKAETPYHLFLLIIGLIFFICTIHFESFRQAFVIILLIPISFIGIFLSFYLFDLNFDQGGYTSFILLSGLVVNGLILLMNDYNYYQKKYPHRSFIDNYKKAFLQKIIPILLTVFSTAVGLIPFVWYGQQEVFWFALAVGTIGGLLFSLLVLIWLIPIFLAIFTPVSKLNKF